MPTVLSETRLDVLKMMVKHPAMTREGIHAMFAAYQTSVEEIQAALEQGVSEAAVAEEMEVLGELFEVLIPHIEMMGFMQVVMNYKPTSFSVPGNNTIH